MSIMLAPSWYADLLSVLTKDRRAHSLAVGRKAAEAASGLEPWMRSDLVAAATLHDIGYGHVVSGFHPLDGARFLAGAGFSATVCHLVAHHTASTYEAEERGIDLAAYAARELMQRMGHSTMAAALHYQHATDQRAREIAGRLSEVVERRRTDAE